MPCGASIRRLSVGVAIATIAAFAHAVTEPPPEPTHLGLYEWMATAPIVVAADITADDAKFVHATVRTSFKGDLPAGTKLEIDLRHANLDREDGARAMDLSKGRGYLLLLQPSARGKHEPDPVFALVRGIGGARALPIEGSAATIDAAKRLADVQARRNDDYLWTVLPEFLEDPNPVLVDAALELYLKFRRENIRMAATLPPLLEHPRPEFRSRAATLLGRVLVREGASALPERSEWIAELTGRARRDDDANVRREATSALAALYDAGIEETLRVIARDDPDQNVRFEAQKALFARQESAGAKRTD
jgi:hypothetical protein